MIDQKAREIWEGMDLEFVNDDDAVLKAACLGIIEGLEMAAKVVENLPPMFSAQDAINAIRALIEEAKV